MNKRFLLVPAVGAAGALFAGHASAEVPALITAAISTMGADGITVATAFVVAAIGVAAIKFLRSAK